jgi:hypothetical protein
MDSLTAEQQVQRQDRIIRIEPAETRRIYVPYYDLAPAAGRSVAARIRYNRASRSITTHHR